jgi:hypothetical protein
MHVLKFVALIRQCFPLYLIVVVGVELQTYFCELSSSEFLIIFCNMKVILSGCHCHL